MATSNQAKASLKYLAPDPKYLTDKPYTCLIDLSDVPGASATNIVSDVVSDIPVTDVRDNTAELSLDLHGFEVLDLGKDFSISDFEDEEWIKKVYYLFIRNLVVDKLGAKEAHVFEHQLRYRHPGFGDKNLRGAPRFDPPLNQVHADQTQEAASARFARHWPNYSEDIWSDRLQIVKFVLPPLFWAKTDPSSVWRPLVPTIEEWPLAVCDFRSVDSERDLRASDIVKPDYSGESYVSIYNPKHAWYYLSKQEYHEAWIIKLFDSEPGVANTVLHASFDIGKGAWARKSCETRVLVRL